jgi:glycosyltransferase involved in cell wall biosynthesis
MPEPFKGIRNWKMTIYTLVDRFVTSLFIDRVIAVSSDIQNVLSQIYGADRVVCIHNGIDLEAAHATVERQEKRKEWSIDEEAVVVGTVGRLVPVKGHAMLLEAMRMVRHSNQNLTLLLVGDGPLRGHLEAEVKRMGLERAVIFAGHQEQSYDFINIMDIFVLPSLHEGIPMVLLEALALKRPVIASRVGGIPEVIENGVSGLLVGREDVLSLANSIRELMKNQSRAIQFGQRGRDRLEHEFNAQLMAAKVSGIYQSLLMLQQQQSSSPIS